MWCCSHIQAEIIPNLNLTPFSRLGWNNNHVTTRKYLNIGQFTLRLQLMEPSWLDYSYVSCSSSRPLYGEVCHYTELWTDKMSPYKPPFCALSVTLSSHFYWFSIDVLSICVCFLSPWAISMLTFLHSPCHWVLSSLCFHLIHSANPAEQHQQVVSNC